MTNQGIKHQYGHIDYSKHTLDLAQAEDVTTYGGGVQNNHAKLHKDAAAAWRRMEADAHAAGHRIGLNYAYRSEAEQHTMYINKVNSHSGDNAKAAETVAPGGHSEHQTGYAIDIYDANSTINQKFEHTGGYQWLKDHAHEYGFVQSFKPGNKQGISTEAWHWRFEGTPEAEAVFANAHKVEQL